MKRKALSNLLPVLSVALALSVLLVNLSGVVGAQGPGPQDIGTAVTYQGRLSDGGAPANGSYDFQFIVYSAAVGGSQAGDIAVVEDVAVTDGFFTVELDCGSGAFTGDPRYLEIGVRPGESTGAYTTLAPRQPLRPAPYALYAQGIPLAGTGTASTAARSDHSHVDSVPSGAVSFFNLASCPSGWHELTDARGRYLTGMPVEGTLGATVGTALSDSENRSVGRHTHSSSDPGHAHSISDPGHNHYVSPILLDGGARGDRDGSPRFASLGGIYTYGSTTGISVGSSGAGIMINNTGLVNGTNAPYLQLLVCEKD